MSTDIAFARLEYPAVHDAEHKRRAAGAVAEGFSAGYTAGMRAARAELEHELARVKAEAEASARAMAEAQEQRVAALTTASEVLRQRAAELTGDAQSLLLRATVELSEAVLGTELRDGEHAARAALSRVLAHPDAGEAVGIRMHPVDAALLRAGSAESLPPIVDDASLDRGDAIADLPEGWIDARLRFAFERAKACLEEMTP
ncbi:FliH/SctL family protein [Ruicaihuangia caeni]|uniref:FliH/SctL family protein n=1 Tax=Ruicaihuangia caeni TaxID=3042517 RepID=A0AAW6T231_9MICO|nr:FliH/SctL family protein [Klugiella sp. YN-L-19]MDI2097880.1 FliH/SctL family protein [Klugiella sp. YN-L-19]